MACECLALGLMYAFHKIATSSQAGVGKLVMDRLHKADSFIRRPGPIRLQLLDDD